MMAAVPMMATPCDLASALPARSSMISRQPGICSGGGYRAALARPEGRIRRLP
jgi:hypothetical protein